MARPIQDLEKAAYLLELGLNDCAIARITGIPRGTIRDWRRGKLKGTSVARQSHCPRCDRRELDEPAYAYLLGLYLGDGSIAMHPRRVQRLRITLDAKYPNVIQECSVLAGRARTATAETATLAMADVKGGGTWPNFVKCIGCFDVYTYWKHWVCVFPQHGPGPKHQREIQLEEWQNEIAIAHPKQLLRGLIHSDGCRDLNRVNGKDYPRYSFVNYSAGIRRIFTDTLDRLNIGWKQPKWQTINVSRRPYVRFMDEFIGPKT